MKSSSRQWIAKVPNHHLEGRESIHDEDLEKHESTLEQRVRQAIQDPSSVDRFRGWSLGESRHLINDAWLFDGVAPAEPQAKRAKPKSATT